MLKVRLVKVRLSRGKYVILATSLLSGNISAKSIGELYGHRWDIEERYKVLKCRCMFGKFTGVKTEAALQDYYSKLVMMNIDIALVQEAQLLAERRTPKVKGMRKVNVTESLSILCRKFHRLLLAKDFKRYFQDIIEEMSRFLEKVKPNRTFPRNHRISKTMHNPWYPFLT